MNDQTANAKALRRRAVLHMPLQAVPIDRDGSPGALAGIPGVEASLLANVPWPRRYSDMIMY